MPRKAEISPEAAAVGKRIAALRDRNGWTNNDFAQRLGMAPSSAKNLITGEANVQFVKLGRLAHILGTTPDEILGFQSGKPEGIFRAALAASYIGLGLAVDEAEDFASAVIRSLEEQPTDSVKLDPETSVRVHVELAARRFARARKPRNMIPKRKKAGRA